MASVSAFSFGKVECELVSSLEKKKISEKLFEYLEYAKKEFESYEKHIIKQKDMLTVLKLLSASDTCSKILENSITELKIAKTKKENPIALKNLYDILLVVVDLGERLDRILKNRSFEEIKSIREQTLALQEEAEKRGLLEPIDKRVAKIPKETRKKFITTIRKLSAIGRKER